MTKKEIRVAYCAVVLITAVTVSMFFNVNNALGSPLEETTLKCSGKVVDSGGAPINGAKVKMSLIEFRP
jgi:hypothetical protein